MEKTNNIEVSQEIEKAFKQINHSNMADGVEKQVLLSIVSKATELTRPGDIQTLAFIIMENAYAYGQAVGTRKERERRHVGKKIANVNRPTFKAKRV